MMSQSHLLLLVYLLACIQLTISFTRLSEGCRISNTAQYASGGAKVRKFTLQGPEKIPQALIAGGGPAGLLTAIALLSRGYKVALHESREDPKNTPLGPRAFSLGLNIRGTHHRKFSIYSAAMYSNKHPF